MADILNCENREITGTLRMRRLRQSGLIPAVLYGKGDNQPLQIPSKDLSAAIRHGSQIVELKGSCNESALIKEVQWDAFGIDVLHVDLARIDATELLELTLQVELVGEAPGAKTGGVVKHVMHSIDVSIPANAVPDKLELRINDLELNGSMKAGEIPLPDGATLVTGADEIVVQCLEPTAQEEEKDEAVEDSPAEPEVIGRKAEDEEGSDD